MVVHGGWKIDDNDIVCENLPTELWKLITGNKHTTGADKNSHIRHPSVRYLHRMLVHAFYPRKQAGTVTEEDMRLLCPAIRPYAQPGVLPLPSTDIYATFGMDAAGPKFIDGTYLRIATYFSGMYGKDYVYQYYLQGKPVEVVLPNRNLTSLEIPGVISFNIPQEYFLGEHGHLDPVHAAPSRRRSVPTRPDSPVADTCEHIYGPPHYYFKPHDGVLPPGALRDAHDHIGRLQRWNKAQDGTIEKLKDKCNALSKTVKKQAKTSAKFMKKVADVLTRGGIAQQTSLSRTPQTPSLHLRLMLLASPSLLRIFSVSGGTHPLNLPLPVTSPHPSLLLIVRSRLTRLRANHGMEALVQHPVVALIGRSERLDGVAPDWSLR
ncbi:hypothetical protein F2Q68_00013902 [Brassica cretica]|uniref:Arabidopsis retrotransposon Orf1 C-terminal domain-containing protein n=1 Tax=Brassica cretica TaxID=69181 RepID=A0A8S9HHH5_BRACR|nr:hypothetical protein F2Q68_00013902 [Brassica cretica]